jgi:hypothetical protein
VVEEECTLVTPPAPELIGAVDTLRMRMDGLEAAMKNLNALSRPQPQQKRERDWVQKAVVQVS